MTVFRHRFCIAAAICFCSVNVNAADYEIDFRLDTAEDYEAIQYRVDFSGASGEFDQDGEDVDCTGNTGLGAIHAFHEHTTDELVAAAISLSDISGAAVLATCVFDSTGGAPVEADFSISIDNWSADHSTAPVVEISRIEAQ